MRPCDTKNTPPYFSQNSYISKLRPAYIWMGLLLMLCAPIVPCAFAEQQQQIISGTCTKLMYGSLDMTSQCQPILKKIVDDSGLIAYVFSSTDSSIASFVGRETTDKSGTLAPLTLSRLGSSDPTQRQRILMNRAFGTCEVKDENNKQTVHCHATRGNGKTYDALFIADITPSR